MLYKLVGKLGRKENENETMSDADSAEYIKELNNNSNLCIELCTNTDKHASKVITQLQGTAYIH